MMKTETRTEDTHRPESRPRGTMSDALWLAKRDIRSSWASFPAAAAVAFGFGLLGVAQYQNALGGEMGAFGQATLDFFLLALVAVTSVNLLFNRDYFNEISDEGFNGRLSFLRSMPVSAKSVVAGRITSMSLALACSATMFFLAPYVFYGELRETVGFGDYVWYFGMWLGYAILAMGGFVFSQFGFNWKFADVWLPLTVALLGGYITVVVVSNVLLDDGLALSLLELATTSSGPLAAAISILTASGAVAFLARIASKRLERRDIG